MMKLIAAFAAVTAFAAPAMADNAAKVGLRALSEVTIDCGEGPKRLVWPKGSGVCHGAIAIKAMIEGANSGFRDTAAEKALRGRGRLNAGHYQMLESGIKVSGWLFMGPDPDFPSNKCGMGGGWVPFIVTADGHMLIAAWAKDCDMPAGEYFYK